jgi:glycerophosphoryl diester phosphodiesterase
MNNYCKNATEANGMKLTLKNLSMAIMMSTIVMGSSAMAADSNEKIVIAHRGASGYLPEHTLPAKAMAYAQGADYLEQDLVMTKDDHLVVLHDHYLDRVTDVADRFPDRARKDGRYYAIDFTLDEIKSLKFTEGFDIENGKKVQTYPGRFPMGKSDFRVHTFEEEIEFVQGLNHSTGKNIGIYPEIKAPWFHHQEGKDIAAKTLEVLKKYGYTGPFQFFNYRNLTDNRWSAERITYGMKQMMRHALYIQLFAVALDALHPAHTITAIVRLFNPVALCCPPVIKFVVFC